jgi:hypothetical protein
MFLKPFRINGFGREIILLSEESIYKEIPTLTKQDVLDYLKRLFDNNEQIISKFTFCAVILWSMDCKLNADVWTFYLKDWRDNTDINVFNFTEFKRDTNPSIVTNGDGLLLIAEIEKSHIEYPDFDSFMIQYPYFL